MFLRFLVNQGTRSLLEICRDIGGRPRFVFASSIAAFGGGAEVSDETKLLPQVQLISLYFCCVLAVYTPPYLHTDRIRRICVEIGVGRLWPRRSHLDYSKLLWSSGTIKRPRKQRDGGFTFEEGYINAWFSGSILALLFTIIVHQPRQAYSAGPSPPKPYHLCLLEHLRYDQSLRGAAGQRLHKVSRENTLLQEHRNKRCSL